MDNGKTQLTEEQEMLAKGIGAMQTIKPVNVYNMRDDSDFGFSAGTIDESMLSEEEKKIVDNYANEIDVMDVNQIKEYGISAQKNISDFSASMLKKVKTYDLGEVGESLKELTVALDSTTTAEKKGILGFFQKAKRSVDSLRVSYERAENNVDRIEKDLMKHQAVLSADIDMYQEMYELNLQYYKELTMYIIAGKKALAKATSGRLVELKNRADETEKQEDVQAYRDYEDMCHRFGKKLSDLEVTRTISIQSAPQVRMIQNNDREMLDRLQSSLANTIPLWRNQLVLSLGINHTKQAVDAQNLLSEKTNELLVKNSETLKMATVGTAKASERPIVDMETLSKCNKDLISTINEVIKIHEQGAQKREQMHIELVKIEKELKNAMMQNDGSVF